MSFRRSRRTGAPAAALAASLLVMLLAVPSHAAAGTTPEQTTTTTTPDDTTTTTTQLGASDGTSASTPTSVPDDSTTTTTTTPDGVPVEPPPDDDVDAEVPPTEALTVRPIEFPVLGPVVGFDDWGACRDACTRFHIGNDLIGVRLQPLVAAVDGTVTKISTGANGTSICLRIVDADDWSYIYCHLNDDTPGTEDNVFPADWRSPFTIAVGTEVNAGDVIGFMGDSGNARLSVPHLHFEIRDPENLPVNPWWSLQAAEAMSSICVATIQTPQLPELIMAWAAATDGDAATVSAIPVDASKAFAVPVVASAIVPTRTGLGFFIVDTAGGVQAFGDAQRVGRSVSRDGEPCDPPAPPASATPSIPLLALAPPKADLHLQ